MPSHVARSEGRGKEGIKVVKGLSPLLTQQPERLGESSTHDPCPAEARSPCQTGYGSTLGKRQTGRNLKEIASDTDFCTDPRDLEPE